MCYNSQYRNIYLNNMENLNLNNEAEKTVEQNQRILAADVRTTQHEEELEERIEKWEEKTEKEEKRLTVTMMVIFAAFIVIATLFLLSYMNGARVIGN